MIATIVVPFRDRGDPDRVANLAYVKQHLTNLDVAPVVVIGDGRDGDEPFNRSAAYNNAVEAFPDTQCFVFHEADIVLDRKQLEIGMRLAVEEPGLVVPFSSYWYLSHEDTARVRAGQVAALECTALRVMSHGRAVGAVNCVSAETMAAVGRWDERFHGWGYDDRAMALAFEVATGQPTRFTLGMGVHLWHKPGWQRGEKFAGGARISQADRAATHRNLLRYNRYRQASSPERIRELTAGLD